MLIKLKLLPAIRALRSSLKDDGQALAEAAKEDAHTVHGAVLQETINRVKDYHERTHPDGRPAPTSEPVEEITTVNDSDPLKIDGNAGPVTEALAVAAVKAHKLETGIDPSEVAGVESMLDIDDDTLEQVAEMAMAGQGQEITLGNETPLEPEVAEAIKTEVEAIPELAKIISFVE